MAVFRVVVLVCLVGQPIASPVDLHTVHTRLIAEVLHEVGDCLSLKQCDTTGNPAPVAARRDAANLLSNGAWSDVDYNDTTRTGDWGPHLHLDRMVNMAAVARSDKSLLAPALRAAGYWLQVDPQSLNWWWNSLRVPGRIADMALVLGDLLPQTLLSGMIRVMKRANYANRTGANLDDEVATAIKRAAIVGNETLMTEAFDRLWKEIRVVQPSGCLDPPPGTEGCATDGIQADHSFHQHGPQLLDGLYGEAYVTATLKFVGISAGTLFAMSPQQSRLFTNLLLDGMQWMSVGSPALWDWSVKGRDMGTTPRHLLFNATLMLKLNTTRLDELKAFGAAITGNGPVAIAGHRSYWTSDYAVVHSTGSTGQTWMASVHMHSNRTVSARCINGEGGLNEHTGDGMVYLYYNNASEYNGAFKNWDWRRLPGITADLGAPTLPCAYADQLLHDSLQMHATGTASDGHGGISGMHLVTRNVSARKAVLMSPFGLVHLADAQCMDAKHCGDIVTTFENSVVGGEVIVFCNGTQIVVPSKTLRRPYLGCTWAWHHGTGYLFPAITQPYLVTNGIDTSANATEPLFSLAWSHTDNNAPNTSLTVIPAIALADVPAAAQEAKLATVANTELVQAVWDKERLQLTAVLWEANTRLHIPNGTLMTTRPCAVIIQHSPDCATTNVTVSDLGNDPVGGVLTLEMEGEFCPIIPSKECFATENVTTVKIPLPSGYSAGQSVSVSCHSSPSL